AIEIFLAAISVGFLARDHATGCGGQVAGKEEQSGCGDWTSRNELFFARIDNEIQSFERAGTQKQEVPFLGEDDFINGEVFANSDDREADTSRDLLTVSHYEGQILLLARYTDSFKR